MLILRIRQCEVAVSDGRLDEAYVLVNAHQIANHRRGQRAITRLVEKLIERGGEHLKALRYTEALADCDKAARLGGNQPNVVALRAAAMDGLLVKQREGRGQARMIADVRRHVDQGQLSVGEGLLDRAEPELTAVVGLKQEIEKKRSIAAATVKAGRRAVDAGDWNVAIERVAEGRAADPNDSQVMELAGEVIAKLQEQVSASMNEGQLDRAGELVMRLVRIDSAGMRTRELKTLVDQVRQVWREVSQGNYGEARIVMGRVAPLLPKAAWVRRVIDQLTKAEEAIAELRTGPLGWVENIAVSADERKQSANPSPQPSPRVRGEQEKAQLGGSLPLPSSLMLRVDGVGSYLVLRQAVVNVGPLSSSRHCDVALVAEANLPGATIERVEDDYFLRTRGGEGKLLTNGEKIELSPRCRMVFRLPSRASTTGVLDLSGARLPRSDVRRVILMDHDLVLGPGSAAHVDVNHLSSLIVLFVRNGQLFVRSRDAADSGQPVTLGAQMNVGGVSFVVTGT